jgi:hypothetical protein
MLITLWKVAAAPGLTPQNSTRWYGLHNVGAMRGNRDARAGNFSRGVTKDTELLAEKHKGFQWKEVWNGKLLHQNGREERKSVEQLRETTLLTSSANSNTTSAGDQDEF